MLVIAVVFMACGERSTTDVAQPMPTNVHRLLLEATESLQRHDFARAMNLVDQAEQEAPGLADVPFLRGRIYTELAQLEEADEAYREALAIRPTYPGGWHNLGNTALRKQQYSEAIRLYHKELANHADPRPWRGIARAYVEMGKADSARYAFEQAIEADETFADAHLGLAQLLADLGELEGAYEAALRAHELEPENPEYRYHVGVYLGQLDRTEEAAAQFEAVIQEWPWHQGAHYNLGQALLRLGRGEAALAMQQRAEELRALQAQISHHENTARVQPLNPEAHAGLGTLLRRAGRYNDAMHAYMAALYLEPGNVEIRNNVAVLHLLRGDTTAAITAFEQLAAADTTQPAVWINLGSLYAMSRQPDKAEAAWQRALNIDPGNEIALKSLAGLAGRR